MIAARRGHRRVRILLKRRDGAVTVEFGLALVPFLLLVLGILELGLIAFSSSTLRNGAYEAARVTRTSSQTCLTNAQIERLVCDATLFAPDCQNRLDVTRRVLGNGWGAGANELLNGVDQNASRGNDVVAVEARYRWTFVTPLIGTVIGDQNGEINFSQRFIVQNEPFDDTTCPVS